MESIQNRINRLNMTIPNTFYERSNGFRKSFIPQLDKVMKEYPAYKADDTNDYDRQLSLLKGIGKQVYSLQDEVHKTTLIAERNINIGDNEIQTLKRVVYNLSKYTSYEELDNTSKQLLSDYSTLYNNNQLLFYVKLNIVLVILIYCIRTKKYSHVSMIYLVSLLVTGILVWIR